MAKVEHYCCYLFQILAGTFQKLLQGCRRFKLEGSFFFRFTDQTLFNVLFKRHISLLETTYKILSKVITRRITSTFYHIKPREQVDFKYDNSKLDHLKSINQLIGKTMKSMMALGVDYQEAFDSITHQACSKHSTIKELKMSAWTSWTRCRRFQKLWSDSIKTMKSFSWSRGSGNVMLSHPNCSLPHLKKCLENWIVNERDSYLQVGMDQISCSLNPPKDPPLLLLMIQPIFQLQHLHKLFGQAVLPFTQSRLSI